MGRLSLANQTVPPTPPPGITDIYVDSADKLAKTIDDTGTVRTLGVQISQNLAAPASTSGTTETLLFRASIPGNSVKVGDTFRCTLFGVSSSTGALTFRVRIGALGTTEDAQAWISAMSAAQVANQWAGMNVLLTIRTIGSPGSAQASGVAFAGAAVLPQRIGAATTAPVTTTASFWISLTAVCSAGTFTAHNATIESLK